MSDLERRPSRTPRRAREQRAYRLVQVGGGAGAGGRRRADPLDRRRDRLDPVGDRRDRRGRVRRAVLAHRLQVRSSSSAAGRARARASAGLSRREVSRTAGAVNTARPRRPVPVPAALTGGETFADTRLRGGPARDRFLHRLDRPDRRDRRHARDRPARRRPPRRRDEPALRVAGVRRVGGDRALLRRPARAARRERRGRRLHSRATSSRSRSRSTTSSSSCSCSPRSASRRPSATGC